MKYHIPSRTRCQIAPDDDRTPYQPHTTKEPITATWRADAGDEILLEHGESVLRVPIKKCREVK